MTRRDYRAIGKALRAAGAYLAFNPDSLSPEAEKRRWAVQYVAPYIADVFEQDNPRFDRERFIRFIETGKDTRS